MTNDRTGFDDLPEPQETTAEILGDQLERIQHFITGQLTPADVENRLHELLDDVDPDNDTSNLVPGTHMTDVVIIHGDRRSVAHCLPVTPDDGSPPAIPTKQAFEPKTPFPLPKRSPNWTAAMVVALVLVSIYGTVRVTTSDESRQNVKPAAAPAPSSHTLTPTHPPARTVAPTPRKEVNIRIKVKQACWLNIRDSSGRQLFSGVMRAGQHEEWTSKKRIRMVIGNGGGVQLTVNGKDLGAPGRSGQVLRLNFGPGDPEND